MDNIFIKEEVEDTYDAVSVSSASESFSNRSSNTSLSPTISVQTSSTNSIPPTQRVQPSTLAPMRGLVAGGFPHYPPSVTQQSSISSNPLGLKRKGPDIANSNSNHQRCPHHCYPQGPHSNPPALVATLPWYQDTRRLGPDPPANKMGE